MLAWVKLREAITAPEVGEILSVLSEFETDATVDPPPEHEPKVGVPPSVSSKQRVPVVPAIVCITPVPFPYRIPFEVKVEAPVPPLATVRGLDKVRLAKVGVEVLAML